MGSHPAGGVGPPERWRGAGAGGALTSGPDLRGAPQTPCSVWPPRVGGPAEPAGCLVAPAVPAPILLHLFKQELCPHFAEEETEAQRSRVGGWCSGPERTLQASDSTNLRFGAPGVTPLHLGCGPPPPGSTSVPPPPPPSLAAPGNQAGQRSPVGRAGSPPPSSFSKGLLRLMFPAFVSSGVSPG